jgi:hypothetical protein
LQRFSGLVADNPQRQRVREDERYVEQLMRRAMHRGALCRAAGGQGFHWPFVTIVGFSFCNVARRSAMAYKRAVGERFLWLSLEDSSQIPNFIVNMAPRRRIEAPQCR